MTESKSSVNYKKLGIVELREVGKRVGIKSPTTLDKKTLLSQIVAIVEGNEKQEGLSVGSSSVIGFNVARVDDGDKLNLMVDFERADMVRGEYFCGYVWLDDNLYGRVSRNYRNNDDDVYLPQTLVYAYRLKCGDFIEGKKVLMKNALFFGAYTVTAINGDKLAGLETKDKILFSRINFDTLDLTAPDTRLTFRSKSNVLCSMNLVCPAARGQRIMLSADEFAERELIKTVILADTVPYVHCTVVDLFISAEERITDISSEKQYLTTDFGTDCDECIVILERAVERAKRNAEKGRDELMFLFGLTKLINRLKFVGKMYELERLIKCVMSGKRLFGKGSLTIAFAVGMKFSDIFRGGASSNAVFRSGSSGLSLDIKNSMVYRPETYLDAADLDAIDNVKKLAAEVGHNIAKLQIKESEADSEGGRADSWGEYEA